MTATSVGIVALPRFCRVLVVSARTLLENRKTVVKMSSAIVSETMVRLLSQRLVTGCGSMITSAIEKVRAVSISVSFLTVVYVTFDGLWWLMVPLICIAAVSVMLSGSTKASEVMPSVTVRVLAGTLLRCLISSVMTMNSEFLTNRVMVTGVLIPSRPFRTCRLG